MTMYSGDMVSCGTNHDGLGFIQNGERLRMKIQSLGEMEVVVSDPIRRTWECGIYHGEDSTHHDSVRRYQPETILRP